MTQANHLNPPAPAAHTPGPWTCRAGDFRQSLYVYDAKGAMFLQVGCKGKMIKAADALLIAAAPALFEACQSEDLINDYIESCDLPDDTKHPLWPVVEKLRAAIDTQKAFGAITPGPWTLRDHGTLSIKAGEAQVAQVESYNRIPLTACRATAQLIASAPLLLAAAEAILNGYDHWEDPEPAFCILQSAVNKARGII